MKNPFTGKEIQGKSISEIFGLNFETKKKEEKEAVNPPLAISDEERLRRLEEKLEQFEAENRMLRTTLCEIAKPEINSIAKIKSVIKYNVQNEEEDS